MKKQREGFGEVLPGGEYECGFLKLKDSTIVYGCT